MERVVNGGDESPSRGRTFRSSFERKTPEAAHAYLLPVLQSFSRARQRILSLWVSQELMELLKLAVPITLTLFLQTLPIFMSLLFVGRIKSEGSLNLDAAALGSAYINISGLAVIMGVSSASETLSAQTYGFRNYKQVGIILQRGILIISFVSVFVICAWLNTESLLLLFQQQPCVARYTGIYVNIYILGLPPVMLYIVLQKFLQTQNIVWPFILVGIINNIVSAVMHSLFIFGLNLGIIGAAAALVVANYTQLLVLLLYMKVRKLHTKTWGGWSWKSLEEWPQYLKLGIPGMIMLFVEWISFEVSAFIVGTIDEVELAVNGILLNYCLLLYTFCAGFSIAVSVRVGNELGAGNAQRAKRAALVAIGAIVIDAVIIVSVTQGLRNYFGSLYNAEEDVKERLKLVVHIACVGIFGDQIQGLMSGIMRGIGYQLRGAVINIVSYYVFGLPIGISLALATDMGVLGVWIGVAVATNLQVVIFSFTLACTNWKKEAEIAMNRGKGSVWKRDKQSKTGVTEDIELNECEPENHPLGEDMDSNILDDATVEHNSISSSVDREGVREQHTEDADQKMALMDEEDHQDISDRANLISDKPDVQSHPLWCVKRLKSKLKLILVHSSLFIIAVICLLVSGIASRFYPPDSIINGNYSECSKPKLDELDYR